MRTQEIPELNKNWSAITLGCWQLAPSGGWGDRCTQKDAEAVIKTALDHGVTAFDTAEGYGDGESERRLGKALGSKKEDVIIISKIWPDAELNPKAYAERLDQSLKALNRDYVDLYLIHWPGDYIDTAEKCEKLHAAMAPLKESGKARLIGLSNFHAKDLSNLGLHAKDFFLNQVSYSLLDRDYEGPTRDFCQHAKIPYMAYSPTAKGLLARALAPEDLKHSARQHDDFYSPKLYPEAQKVFEVVKDIASSNDRPPVQVAMAWVLAQPNILTAIGGSKDPQQVAEFCPAGDWNLSAGELERLNEASDQFQKMRQSVTA